MDRIVDLRSDTVTRPTPQMYEAMVKAKVGDDVFRDDPTVIELEELAAEKVGKEASLFVASGTMGNIVAIMTHTRPTDAVIVERDSHTYTHEVGGLAAIAGVLPIPLKGESGFMRPEDIEAAITPPDIHFARTTLLAIENTHNLSGGVCLSPHQTAAMAQVAKKHGLKVHLDGARIFNSAVAQGFDVRELTKDCDSVMFSLSKGLCCPVGSMLCGTKEFIDEARRNRKLLGGGMRQAGILAACGIVALKSMIDRLAEDHQNARRLGEALANMKGIEVDLEKVQTNMVYCRVVKEGMNAPQLERLCAERGVLFLAMDEKTVRLVTHKDVDQTGIDQAIDTISAVLKF